MSSLSQRSFEAERRSAVPALAVAIAYLLIYLALDWVSFIHPMRGLNITPWNPQSAVAVALLFWRPRAWWLVWIGLVGSDLVVRGTPQAWAPALLAGTMLTSGYAATAWASRRWLAGAARAASRRDFVAFLLIVALGAILNALLYTLAFAAFGMPSPDRLMAAVLRGWIGDAVGYLVTLPLLFTLGVQVRRTRSVEMMRTGEWWLVCIVAVACAYAVFGRTTEEQFKFFYLLFVPVVWSAARFGVTGAVWISTVVQLLLVVAFQSSPYRPLTVFELQVLMAALAATGLLLGTTVDEREEAEQALRASLHLAAAGDMAAALAHELNQPLTALSTYARASQLLAERLGRESRSVADPLLDVTSKLVGEASRASDVVKHLRNFFRERATELKPTDIAPLLDEVSRAQAVHAVSLKVRLQCSCDPGVPPVWLDRVQIAVVLRNLVANAVEAAPRTTTGDACVTVRAYVEQGHVTISVLDSGPGLAAAEVLGVFESPLSSKPGGMGIGLGISRAIVAAHGGRLWAEPGPGGRFYFSLPIGVQAHE
jgi:signal transduction histidine kinase